jgi:hypothetical protein
MENCDPLTETAKAVQEAAKVAGKGIDASRQLGGFASRFIAGPMEQVSGMLVDHLKFTRWERQTRLISRAEEIAAKAGVATPYRLIPLNVAAPLMLEGSLEEDDELQDRYARILVNAVDSRSNIEIRRMHGDILSQLGPLEIKILDALYHRRNDPNTDSGVLGAFLPDRVESGPRYPKKRNGPVPLPQEHTQVALLNLIRMGCIISTSPDFSTWGTCKSVAITPLGLNFVHACTTSEVPG